MFMRTSHIGDRVGPTGPTKALCTMAAGVLGIAALGACGSESDDDVASATTMGADAAAAVATTEVTSVVTTVVATTVPATTATTAPPATDPPATDPPVTEPATIEYPLVVEGTTTEPGDQMGSRGEGPNGRRKYYNVKVFDGGLVGEGDAVGSWWIGETSALGAEVLDFDGELVGVGSGTFSYVDRFSVTAEGEFTGSAEILGTGGAFEGLVGAIEYSSPDFGATRTFRAEFTPAPTGDGALVAPPLTVETAAAIADEYAIAFNTGDFDRVAQRLGPDGTWIAMDGTVYDQSSIADFLGIFEAVITDVFRTGEYVEGLDGFAFEMSLTLSGGDEKTFWLAVSRDDAGVVTYAEYPEAPAG